MKDPFFNLAAFWKDSFPRGLALFFGSFALLNLAGDLFAPGFDANMWWIDLSFVHPFFGKIILLFLAICLLTYGFRPPITKGNQFLVAASAAFIGVIALMNAGTFFSQLTKGNVKSGFPVPLSLFVSVAFFWIAIVVVMPQAAVLYRRRFLGIAIVFLACIFAFPVLQVFCFGKTDYRRKADVVVVLGARAYENGEPSDALADRVRTACDLYTNGLVKKVIFSGGPGDGTVHETEAMRRYAIKLGVKSEDILADENGLNTQATVHNTEPMFEKLEAERILVVSHFYHLPRIKMAYQRDGWKVFTVPAKEKYFLRQTPYMIGREVGALWVYYLRGLKINERFATLTMWTKKPLRTALKDDEVSISPL